MAAAPANAPAPGYGSGLNPADQKASVSRSGHGASAYVAAINFEDLKLPQALNLAIADLKFAYPSKIQAEALPIILSPQRPNMIGQAPHGSGKTAAFALGVLAQIDESKKQPQAILLFPTQQLAEMLADVVAQLAKFTQIKVTRAVPEYPYDPTAQVVCGTLGTVHFLVGKKRELNLSGVRVLLVDEADTFCADRKQLDSVIDLRSKISRLNKNLQVLLFSATFPPQHEQNARAIAPNAIKIHIERVLHLNTVSQYYIQTTRDQAIEELKEICSAHSKTSSAIVFAQRREEVHRIFKTLKDAGFSVGAVVGDMDPSQRRAAMDDFVKRRTTILITTNLLSRGIDIRHIGIVVNMELPYDPTIKGVNPETYLHRVGRSGRWDDLGMAFTFVQTKKDLDDLKMIATLYKCEITEAPVPSKDLEGFEKLLNDAFDKQESIAKQMKAEQAQQHLRQLQEQKQLQDQQQQQQQQVQQIAQQVQQIQLQPPIINVNTPAPTTATADNNTAPGGPAGSPPAANNQFIAPTGGAAAPAPAPAAGGAPQDPMSW